MNPKKGKIKKYFFLAPCQTPMVLRANLRVFRGKYMDEKKLRMVRVVVRKVLFLGGSLYICLPSAFVKKHAIRPGDQMALIVGENLKITPLER